MNPFNFKIEISKEEKRKRRIAYIIIAVLLCGIFLYGFATVYANCYNSMNSEPMTVFEFNKNDDGLSVIIFNHMIELY